MERRLPDLTRSKEYLARAESVLPGYSCCYSRAPLSYARGSYPSYIEKGRGCVLIDVDGNEYIDTTMGLTPTGGLPMGIRSGDLDPGVLLHLLREQGYTPAELEQMSAVKRAFDPHELGRAGDQREREDDHQHRGFGQRRNHHLAARSDPAEGRAGVELPHGLGERLRDESALHRLAAGEHEGGGFVGGETRAATAAR